MRRAGETDDSRTDGPHTDGPELNNPEARADLAGRKQAGHEQAGRQDQAGHELAGHELAGQEQAGHELAGQDRARRAGLGRISSEAPADPRNHGLRGRGLEGLGLSGLGKKQLDPADRLEGAAAEPQTAAASLNSRSQKSGGLGSGGLDSGGLGSKGLSKGRGASALGPRGRDLFSRLFGSSKTNEQAQRRRHPAVSREAVAIAIASGKGGTGKSFLSTSLAVLLHQSGRRVTLVDCDYGLACDHLLLGVNPKLTLRHLLTGQARLQDIRIETPAGPALVPGGSGIRQMAHLSDQELLTFGRSLGELAATEDVVLLDLGAGISSQTILTLTAADHVVLVTQPEIAALTDAYALCKNLTQVRKDSHLHVVVNRVVEPGQGTQAYDKLSAVMQRFTGLSLGYLGEIPEDPLVTQRRLGQMPIVATDADSPTTRAVSSVLTQLEAAAGSLAQREVIGGRGIEQRLSEHRLFL